jgi:hypothetical protein
MGTKHFSYGMRQACGLSPILFKMHKTFLKEWTAVGTNGIKLNKNKIN